MIAASINAEQNILPRQQLLQAEETALPRIDLMLEDWQLRQENGVAKKQLTILFESLLQKRIVKPTLGAANRRRCLNVDRAKRETGPIAVLAL
jgi:hypothetical protein